MTWKDRDNKELSKKEIRNIILLGIAVNLALIIIYIVLHVL